MAWEKHELEALEANRRFYLDWIEDVEAGRDPITTRRELGRPIDDRDEKLAHWRRNVEEIDAILTFNGIDPNA